MILFIMTGCVQVKKQVITIQTNPTGATISVAMKDDQTGAVTEEVIGTSPVQYEVIVPKYVGNTASFDEEGQSDFQPVFQTNDPKYIIKAVKEGHFTEKKSIIDYTELFQAGTLNVSLDESPLWLATAESSATNQWVNLIVSSGIPEVDMWQRVVDAVTIRFPDLKEYDYVSGYLATVPKIKTFETSRGTFILRSKFIATVKEREPLTYRLKLISDWSDQTRVQWHPYPRVFIEDKELVNELMSRFQAY